MLSFKQPLGIILQEADLISSAQLEVALMDKSYYHEMKIGEIVALRGWIKQETADFFAEQWLNLLQESPKQPLGFYLQQAALLNEEQIKSILLEQHQTWIRFGAVAVIKGWLTQNTIDFFVENLFPQQINTSLFIGKVNTYQLINRINCCEEPENQRDVTQKIDDDDDIPWIG